MKKKNDEMEAKVYSLRNEKMELDRRFSEVQSTLDSLKDEQSIMEIAFEEKQKEIRLLREEEAKWGKEFSEVTSLSERLKQKEAEIEDLKQRLAGNLVENQNLAEQEKTEVTEDKGNDMGLHESRNRIINGDQTMRDEDSSKSSIKSITDKDENVESLETRETSDRREMRSAEMQKQENLEDGGGRKTGDSDERVRNEGADEEDTREKRPGKEDASTQPRKFENFMDGLQQRKADNSGIASNSGKVRRRHLRKGRAKRWRTMVKSQLLGDNEVSESNEEVLGGRNRNIYKTEQEQLRDVVGDEVVADNSIKVSAKSKGLKPEDAKETDGEVAKQRVEEVHSWTDSGRHIKQETGNEDNDDDNGGYDAKESDSSNEDEKDYKDK